MKILTYISFIVLSFLFSCQNSSEIAPEQKFNKIYSENSFSDFDGIDILQTDDGGYCILGITDNSFSQQLGIPYLLRTDKEGNFLWDSKSNSAFQLYSNPIPNLKNKDNSYFFFCRRILDKVIVLIKVNDAQKNLEVVSQFPDLKGDIVYVSDTPDQGQLLMLLSETCGTGKRPELIKLNANFGISWRKCYDFNVFVPVNAITQRVNNNYFFNGVFTSQSQTRYFMTLLAENNTSSILYTDLNGTLLGITRTPFLVNSLTQIADNNFAFTFIRQRDTNIVPKETLRITANEQRNDIFGNTFHEINSEKTIIAKRMTLNGKEAIIFACTLENIPIRVYAFDPATGNLKGTLTLGRVNPYDVVDIIPTTDGGLAIAVNTLVADRFKRLGILKISPQEVVSLVN